MENRIAIDANAPSSWSAKNKAASSALPVAPRREIGYRAAFPSGQAALYNQPPI